MVFLCKGDLNFWTFRVLQGSPFLAASVRTRRAVGHLLGLLLGVEVVESTVGKETTEEEDGVETNTEAAGG